MRVRSLYSSYYFAKVVLGYARLIPTLHQADMELFLSRLEHGHQKQWIEWSRGFFKTTCFTIGTSMWFVLPVSEEDTEYAIETLRIPEDRWFSRIALHDQDATQLLAFETIDNAKKKVGEIKWHFEDNQLFRTCFPEIAHTGGERKWNNECLIIRRAGYRSRAEEGTFEAIGVGGALQSRHYKIVWEDDLVGKKATESQVEMEKTIRWHGLLHGAFENAAEQWRFGVSNRWGYADLNAYVREHEPDFVFHTRSAWEIGDDGREVPIFPVDGLGEERYTMAALHQIQSRGSMSAYDFACQYLNTPRLPGEREVDATKIHRYTVGPDAEIKCSCGVSLRPSQLLRYMHFDPYNARGARSSSRPAIVVVGTSTDKHVFLLDYYVGKGDYNKIYEELYRNNDAWKPGLFTYEDVGHQNMVEFHIKTMQDKQEFKDAKHRRFPRILGTTPHGRAKEIRIRDTLFPLIQQGKFAARDSMLAFFAQLDTFPYNVPDHDYDLLDALEDGVEHWRFPQADEDGDKAQRDEDDIVSKLGLPYSHMEVAHV